MLIGSSTQTYITNTNSVNANSGKQLPPEGIENTQSSPEITSNTDNVNRDFTNMSPSEYYELVKSGEIEQDHFVLAFAAVGIDPSGDINAAKDVKINYIELVKERIEYRESMNLPTDIYDKMLSEMQKVQAAQSTPRIDTYA